MTSIGTVASGLMERYQAARKRPRVPCRICGQPECLDLDFLDHTCTVCNDREQQARVAVDLAARLQQRIQQSELPESFHDVSFETFDSFGRNPHALAAARHALRPAAKGRRGQGLCMLGDTGTGKTLLCAALIRAWCESGDFRIRYVYAPELRSGLERGRFDKHDVITELAHNTVLFLDDLTFEAPPQEFVRSEFNRLIDLLYSQGKTRLFLTSNLPLNSPSGLSLRAVFGPRFVRRVKELCHIVQFA